METGKLNRGDDIGGTTAPVRSATRGLREHLGGPPIATTPDRLERAKTYGFAAYSMNQNRNVIPVFCLRNPRHDGIDGNRPAFRSGDGVKNIGFGTSKPDRLPFVRCEIWAKQPISMHNSFVGVKIIAAMWAEMLATHCPDLSASCQSRDRALSRCLPSLPTFQMVNRTPATIRADTAFAVIAIAVMVQDSPLPERIDSPPAFAIVEFPHSNEGAK